MFRSTRSTIYASTHSIAAALFFSFVLLAFNALPVGAQTYSDLHDYAVYVGTLANPWLMAEGRDNNLYGTTAVGGTHQKGTIFKVGPSGGYTVLYNFDGPHGSQPLSGLTLGLDGNLYGMAEREGAHGYGNIFKITPAGAFSVVYDFKGGPDGGLPTSPLIVGADGNFYGTSYPGAAFRMTPAGVVTVISKIPTSSYAPLLQAKDGTFYGVTEFGGKYSAGSVFHIVGGNYTILHSFDGPSGSYPTGGLVEGSDGNFYGTTTAGGSTNAGVVYRINTSGGYRVMFDWDNVHTLNGYQSYSGMIAGADGNLYGTTVWGGQYGYGVLFSMTTDGDYSVLYDFNTPTGQGAYATPMQHTNGKIYGITSRGGAAYYGVVYSFTNSFAPFIQLTTNSGLVGNQVGILGKGFAQASSVEFNGTPASFHVLSNTFMTATIPSGETGFVRVNMAFGDQTSSRVFRVTPQITLVSPHSGKAGDTITVTGKGLIQAENITVGGVRVSGYTVNSDSKLTFAVPAKAKTGRVQVQTPGGTVLSAGTFTVTP